MSNKDIVLIILFLIMIVGSLIIIYKSAPEEQATTPIQENCEHEFVTVSEYNWWFNSYKTFSRCIKCGKEIR